MDLGTKRVGVAASDPSRILASPVTVLLRRGDRGQDHRAIREIIDEYEADVVVVGLPLSLNGKESHAARLVRDEVKQMTSTLGIPIVLHDERFTTSTAHASMKERNMNAQKRREVVDKVAAAVMLQGWLDQQSYAARQATAEAGNSLMGNSIEVEELS